MVRDPALDGGQLTLAGRRGDFSLSLDLRWGGRVLALVGPSGAGKTSLFEAVLGLWRGAQGRVVLGGAELQGPGGALPLAARRLGWVPQDLALFPHLSVAQHLAFAAASAQAAQEAAAQLGLEGLLQRRVEALSGGERQRVALGRALASRPRALLLDEPLSSLDRPLRARILADLAALKEAGLPMLLISHDLNEVWALADEVAVIEGGRLVAAGPTRQVLAAPDHRDLLSVEGVEGIYAGHFEAGPGQGILHFRTEAGLALALRAGAAPPPAGSPGRVAVRAEDVIVAAPGLGRTSARNALSAQIVAIEPLGRQRLVTAEVGAERLQAQLTPAAIAALELEVGAAVTLLIKAQSVRRLPR